MSDTIKIAMKFTTDADAVIKAISSATDHALQSMAMLMAALAKRPPPKGSPVAGVRVPEWSWVKKTKGPGGHNRDSIRWEKMAGLKYMVRTETGYGGFLELGTSKMPARPYLAPAYTEAEKEFLGYLTEGLE
ncbi:MAG: hypothetical protein KJ050_10645 [Candidatus Omnitrophica bacterium]|nr:hypothetical protein [Candidatus Omnitrophota bacterium]